MNGRREMFRVTAGCWKKDYKKNYFPLCLRSKVHQMIKNALSASYEQSLIRKTIIGTLIFIPVLIINFLLVFAANQLFGAQDFGKMYLFFNAISIGIMPFHLLGLKLSQFIGRHASKNKGDLKMTGPCFLCQRAGKLANQFLLAATVFLSLVIILDTFNSNFVWLLLLGVCFLSVLVTEATIYVQMGLRQISKAGFLKLLSSASRLMIFLTITFIFATAELSLLFYALSANLTWLLHCYMARRSLADGKQPTTRFESARDENWRAMVSPFVVFSLFLILANVDLILALLVMDDNTLGVYSASSLLPRAIFTCSIIVVQTFVSSKSETLSIKQGIRPFFKGILLLFCFTGGASIFAYVTLNTSCGDTGLIDSCDTEMFTRLLIAIPFLASARLAIVGILLANKRESYTLSIREDKLLMTLVIVIISFFWSNIDSSVRTLQINFVLLSIIAFVVLSICYYKKIHEQSGTV